MHSHAEHVMLNATLIAMMQVDVASPGRHALAAPWN